MSHPTNRAERRHQRNRIISHRRRIRINCNWEEQIWSKFSKWNGNCGSTRCHYAKYYKCKAARRRLRKNSNSFSECRAGDRKGIE